MTVAPVEPLTADAVAERVGSRRKPGGGFTLGGCPAHGGRGNLSIKEAEDGRVLLHCFAGCTFEEVVAALGIEPRQLFEPTTALPRSPPRRTPPSYPPATEVEALWSAAGLVTDDAQAVDYLRGRGIAPDRVEELDLARVVPGDRLDWAVDWGWRLLVPLLDATGAMRSFRARSYTGSDRKTLVPGGFTTSGLVMCDALARRLLRGEPDAQDLVREAGLWIAEGEIDFLTVATSFGEAQVWPAVLGLASGGWTAEHGAKVPPGTVVTLAVDRDKAGETYAAEVLATLGPGVTVRRWSDPCAT